MHSRCLDAIKANVDIHIRVFPVAACGRSSVVMSCSAMPMTRFMSVVLSTAHEDTCVSPRSAYAIVFLCLHRWPAQWS